MPDVLDPQWLGRRVSVRRITGRRPDGRPTFGDIVGDLVRLDADVAVVETTRGAVEVAPDTIAVARLAPPSTADELALEAVAARGWRAAETSQLGGWLLRADGGFTNRANSVLPLRTPGVPIGEALATARGWYAARGLPLRIHVPTGARRLLDADLGERGWPAGYPVHVMTARLDTMTEVAPVESLPDVEVTIAERPDDAWLARFRDGAVPIERARALLSRHDRVGFATIRDGAATVAIGRGCVDEAWLGISAVEVDPAFRRRGLARAVLRALWAWGRDRGATRSYLQVGADNGAAAALYAHAGYWVHHDYRYRTEPEAADAPA
jgi:GNAT superfamily N-acetyltransferase